MRSLDLALAERPQLQKRSEGTVMKKNLCLLLVGALACSMLAACGGGTTSTSAPPASASSETTSPKTLRKPMVADISTMDVQHTSKDYEVPMNVFDRLFEIKVDDSGAASLVNNLCQEYTVSEDGLTYDFALVEGVTFSNGDPLTANDVKYTFERMLKDPLCVNTEAVDPILGADALLAGEADELEGIVITDDTHFSITLAAPDASFLYKLATPACSIYNAAVTEAAGDQFGIDPAVTIGTGPYVVDSWEVNTAITLSRNENYWGELPDVEKVIVSVIPDPSTQSMMFQNGELDLLDLDYLDSSVVNSTYKTQYADNLIYGNRLAITYMSMNQNIEPFNDVRVRKAVQMAIDRQALLDAVYSGDGNVEDGIFPRGLVGHNPDLEGTITYDPEGAKALLAEAGYADGFTMQFDADNSASSSVMLLYQIIHQQLAEVGITVKINSMDESSWLDLRSSGDMNSFIGTWTADYNDPDNFIYTFFGNEEKTTLRSLNYPDTEVMQRVADARAIVDTDERLAEYADLEYKIVIEDAAWVPLFSRQHLFAVGDNVESFIPFWAGYGDIIYRDVTLKS